MKIASIETIPLRIPFEHNGKQQVLGTKGWNLMDMCIVKVTTDNGLVGWGDAFSFHCLDAVKAAVDHMIAPALIGEDARDIARISHMLQQKNHLFGRYGITMHAISGVDIALWDIAGKAAGLPLAQLLGGNAETKLEGYSSLFLLRDVDAVVGDVKRSLDEGYRYIKLHEIGEAEVAAARGVAGDEIKIMVDTNCPWTPAEAMRMAVTLDQYDLYWLEEPIFPPEDFASLARVREQTGVPLAAGENWCTSFQFAQAFDAGAVDFAQPSVTKVGGISEFRKVASVAEARGVQIMPHCPYFGPGFIASLHLAASLANPGLVERFYIDLEAEPYADWTKGKNGYFDVPTGPGLGVEPDLDVLKDYRV